MTDKPLLIDRSQEQPGRATITLKDKKKIEIPMHCEFICKYITIARHDTGFINQPLFLDVPGIALWSFQAEDLEYISIGGPLCQPQEIKPGPDGEGELTGLELSLCYRALERYKPPKDELKVYNEPLMEYMSGHMRWWQEVAREEYYTLFTLDLILSHKLLGHLQELHFESPPMFREGIPGNDCALPEPADYQYDSHAKKTLKILFTPVNINHNWKQWTEPWMKGVEEVWGQKANICFDVDYNKVFGTLEEAKKYNDKKQLTDPPLNVYLVNEDLSEYGGGVTDPPKVDETIPPITPRASIRLQVDKSTYVDESHGWVEYKYLLAHELGHVFGLQHYNEGRPPWCGAYGSIMMPSDKNAHTPSPAINPLSNIQILEKTGNAVASILVRNEPTDKCQKAEWNPDPEQWYIWVTDKPLWSNYNDYIDCSQEDNLNVQCYQDRDNTPVKPESDHLDEEQLDPQKPYYLCVRLSDLQLSDLQLLKLPVTVHLFLVGDTSLYYLNPKVDPYKYYLTFYPNPEDEKEGLIGGWIAIAGSWSNVMDYVGCHPKTRSVLWNIDPTWGGDYTLYAVIQDNKEDKHRTPEEKELIRIVTKTSPSTMADAATLKKFVDLEQQNPEKYKWLLNYIKSVEVSFPPIQT